MRRRGRSNPARESQYIATQANLLIFELNCRREVSWQPLASQQVSGTSEPAGTALGGPRPQKRTGRSERPAGFETRGKKSLALTYPVHLCTTDGAAAAGGRLSV